MEDEATTVKGKKVVGVEANERKKKRVKSFEDWREKKKMITVNDQERTTQEQKKEVFGSQ